MHIYICIYIYIYMHTCIWFISKACGYIFISIYTKRWATSFQLSSFVFHICKSAKGVISLYAITTCACGKPHLQPEVPSLPSYIPTIAGLSCSTSPYQIENGMQTWANGPSTALVQYLLLLLKNFCPNEIIWSQVISPNHQHCP